MAAKVYKKIEIVGTVGKKYPLRKVGAKDRSVINFSVAVTPSIRNSDDEWEDGETIWTSCTAWGRTADHIDESFEPGDRVFISGRADMQAAYTNKDGEERPAREILIVDVAGHENSYNVTRSERKKSSQSSSRKKSSQSSENKKEDDDKKSNKNLDEFDLSEFDDLNF